ncbi:MAG TPA: hypothetical protein VHY48_06520 [Acidobacteriaceae bacterium]|nr:hypothetical protein [Acidobacteriaceae bacterium]
MRETWIDTLLALECFHVAFLLLHDWVPLGGLNDVQAVRAENPGSRLLRTTLISAAPFVVGLVGSFWFLHRGYPMWLWYWLWASYALLFAGELNAWWIPYVKGTTEERVKRYRAMFGRTWAFLPERNGIVPNALHVVLHAATLATLGVLGALTF